MGTIQEEAIQAHVDGLNCSQAVLTTYSKKLSFDKDFAASIACGFGGGMGRLQETCGAVTGGFMVLGISTCKKYPGTKDRKDHSYSLVQQFAGKFKAMNGSLDCKTLLKCDLNTAEGQKFMKDNNLSQKVCNKCIADSISIIEELVGER
jgi:C_GCAxxG_C_C family probable redox protein